MAKPHKTTKAYNGKDYTCNAGGKSAVSKGAKSAKNGGDVGKSPFSSAGGGSADKSPIWK